MDRFHIWVLLFLTCHLLRASECAVEVGADAKNSLLDFAGKLTANGNGPNPSFGWNNATNPCTTWYGITCEDGPVIKLLLNRTNVSGIIDASDLCNVDFLASSLVSIRLDGNRIGGEVSDDIGNCRNLTHLILGNNQLTGSLPGSLAMLSNLKVVDVSDNRFDGVLPDMSGISGLNVFLAHHNNLSGTIHGFDFVNLKKFNVSFNNLSGPIPDVEGRFPASSFAGNPGLCGFPLPNFCQLTSSGVSGEPMRKKGVSDGEILMYLGYAVMVLIFIVVVVLRFCRTKKTPPQKVEATKGVVSEDEVSEYKSGIRRSELSMNSAENSMVSKSVIVITSPVVNGLKFEDLLRAPAELLGRGKHGSLYKVIYENGMVLAVKRIKDWTISSSEFKHRMSRIYQASHPNVLPALAFYSSKQEKLLVYEYQQNGSLFRFLHGARSGQAFDWASRLGVASAVAQALAFMHQQLIGEEIAHGNLKSSNILLNINMEPCISEYGLMQADDQVPPLAAKVNGTAKGLQQAEPGAVDPFKADTYSYGVILLELLTGKLVQSDGMDLTTWVHSVVREEWTVEVFDRSLISEGASEESMVNLLQVAIKCVNRPPEARPLMSQVALMISAIKENDERSVTFET